MIKIILLLLLATPVQADVNRDSCKEIYDILLESVAEEYIKEQDALSIYKRCLASSN